MPGFVRRYLVDKVFSIISQSSSKLESSYPSVFQIYRTFKTGQFVLLGGDDV